MAERFTLLSELGRGGMGVVWKARDEQTGQIVALKLLREMYAEDPDYRARFERELELAMRIRSDHVVKVLGYGVRDRIPYLALEFVDGSSLHDRLVKHGPYDWDEARQLLGDVALGLADAHAAGVIHRDVKPSNVLIAADGTVKLTDFGIARGLDLTRVTATSAILGTPAYLAPEGPKDARSDLYSLGVVGYELLAGATPFKGTTYQEIILAHFRDAPDLKKLPKESRRIIGSLLEKNPDKRPASARALLALLGPRRAVVAAPPVPSAAVVPSLVGRSAGNASVSAPPPSPASPVSPASPASPAQARVSPPLSTRPPTPAPVLPSRPPTPPPSSSRPPTPSPAPKLSGRVHPLPESPAARSGRLPVLAGIGAVAGVVCLALGSVWLLGSRSSAIPSASSAGLGALGSPAAASVGLDSPSPSASTVPGPDLTTTTYKPEAVGNRGGTLTIGEWQEPSSVFVNIFDSSPAAYEIFGMSLWSLWNVTADHRWFGQLATNVPTTQNGGVKLTDTGGMDLTVDLQPAAKWSDGQPITCADLSYQASWQMSSAIVSSSLQGSTGWDAVAGVDGGTTTHCVVHFKHPYGGYLSLWSPLLPAHYLQTVSPADAQDKLYQPATIQTGVYSGPYLPIAWDQQSILLIHNPAYWPEGQSANFGAIEVHLYPDPASEAAAFKSGEIDVALGFDQRHVTTLSSAGVSESSMEQVDMNQYEHNTWNMASLTSKFGESDARTLIKALHYAYDKGAINTAIAGGAGDLTCNPVSKADWYYLAWDKPVDCPALDVAKANSILDAAGFTKGSDGIRKAPNGARLELQACSSTTIWRVNTLKLVTAQLQSIGVQLDLSPVPASQLFGSWSDTPAGTVCNVTHGTFDVVDFSWVYSFDPSGLDTLYNSAYAPGEKDPAGLNFSRVSIAAVDSALADLSLAADPIRMRQDMLVFQHAYLDPDVAFPEIPLYFWTSILLKSSAMHNVVNNGTGVGATWNVQDWWRS